VILPISKHTMTERRTVGYGNYWSDWIGPDDNGDGIVDISYNLTGSAGAKDYYPLSGGYGIPEPSVLILAGIMTLISIMICRTRKRQQKNL
jgi:hypothetical protein